MYGKGDLKRLIPVLPSCNIEHGMCDDYDGSTHMHEMTDARTFFDEHLTSPCAYLTHSCQEWVIGGPEAIKNMIADLQNALKTMEVR